MREIKFRVWDERTGTMCYPPKHSPVLEISYEEGWFHLDQDFDVSDDIRPPTNSQLMQYTGLKDRNGVNIYEGDILKRTLRETKECRINSTGQITYQVITEVVWRGMGFDFKDTKIIEKTYFLGLDEELEVLGNIYENPELLEG